MTNVFVGGLAWETPKEALRDHFDVYGEFLDAVIISDKITGRSKGYDFVTLKEAEAAKKACEEATPIINGRRSNCNTGVARSPTPPVRLVLHVEEKLVEPNPLVLCFSIDTVCGGK
ncbi:probable RNA-binding protein ARP1 [Camellia sinensis]|uniref:probable RNA-binding protein ARP1 n=1 Tax=Camellia sinensis TaxID=4442 RepID=UPI001036C698|nr:probable RNA-binding protein ARP1 [Camellia sinensis]